MGAPSHDGGQAGARHVGDEAHSGGDLAVGGSGFGVICRGEACGDAGLASSVAVKRAVTRGWPEAMAMSQDSSRVTDRAAASTSSGACPGARVVTVMMVR